MGEPGDEVERVGLIPLDDGISDEMETKSVTDDFDPEASPDVAANPFSGAVVGVVRMGTLRHVLGAADADPVYAELDRAEQHHERELARVLGRAVIRR